jgi:hypothetical protein
VGHQTESGGSAVLQLDNHIKGVDLSEAVGDVQDALSRGGSQHIVEQT